MPTRNGRSIDQVKHLLDALNCGAALLDRNGVLVHVNRRLCQMAARECDELCGANVLDLYDNETDRQVLREMLEHFDQRREAEFFLPLPGGQRLAVISSSRQLPGPPPLSDHRVVTMIDISRQKNAEEQLKDQYRAMVELSDTVLQQAMELKNHAHMLEIRVRQRTRELHEANMDAIFMLAVAAEAKDQDTGRHVRRIQAYSAALAKQLGLAERDAESIGYASILHDVGKIHVPDRILDKPGPLTEDERIEMQQHTVVGERILSPKPFFDTARQIARSHHENWDGSGYPDNLSGEEIPLAARIVHVADVYDALTTRRAYKDPWPPDRAAGAIEEGRGVMFQPEVADAFKRLLLGSDLHEITESVAVVQER